MSFPELIKKLCRDGERILSGCRPRPVTLRINTLKRTAEEGKRALFELGFHFLEVPWYEAAVILQETEKDIRGTKLFEHGEIYLQSLSSMLPPLYLGAKDKEDVLDMTAAPGGKTTELCALTENRALVTACERDKTRCDRLRFNVERQGARANVLQRDALLLEDGLSFDRILLDAPCSGSGTVVDLSARLEKSFVERCALRQEKLLKKAFSLLKKGGTLLYSTCSVLPRENDDVIKKFLKTGLCRLVPIAPPEDEHLELLESMEGTISICPNEYFEGFYLAKLER